MTNTFVTRIIKLLYYRIRDLNEKTKFYKYSKINNITVLDVIKKVKIDGLKKIVIRSFVNENNQEPFEFFNGYITKFLERETLLQYSPIIIYYIDYPSKATEPILFIEI